MKGVLPVFWYILKYVHSIYEFQMNIEIDFKGFF